MEHRKFYLPFQRSDSESFVVGQTDWSLRLYTMNEKLGCSLKRAKNGPESIAIGFEISLIDPEGPPHHLIGNSKRNFLRDDSHTSEQLGLLIDELESFRSKYLKKDTLIVSCCLWLCNQKIDEPLHYFARTRNGEERRLNFNWTISDFSTLRTTVSKEVPLLLASCEGTDMTMKLQLIPQKDSENLISIALRNADGIKWLSLSIKMHVLDAFGKKRPCAEEIYPIEDLKTEENPLTLRLTKSELIESYSPSGVLKLACECSFSQIVVDRITRIDVGDTSLGVGNSSPHARENNNHQNGADGRFHRCSASAPEVCFHQTVLANDLRTMYESGKFCDFVFTTGSKSFRVHRNILCARSRVFANLVTRDFQEKLKHRTGVADVDADTMDRMLVYVYTGTLEQELDWESTMRLCTVADKYELLHLKDKCLSVMEQSLSVANACQMLIHADMHSNHAFKTHVQKFIQIESRKIFSSDEWKELKKSNLALANEVMELKLIDNL